MFLLVIVFAAIFNIISCSAIELEDAISKAISNSAKLKSQLYKYKSSERQIKFHNLSGFLPEINFLYSLNKRFSFDTINNINNGLRHEWNIMLNQKIIDFASTFATFNRSSDLLKAEKMKFQQLRQETAMNAVKAYLEVIRRMERLKLKEYKERVSLEHLSLVERQFSNREITNAKVLLAKANFLSSVSEKVDAEANLKLAKIAYLQLIGEDPNELSNADDQLPYIVPKLEECIRLARINNLSIKEASYYKKASKNKIFVEFFKLLPSLNFSISKDFKKDFIFNTILDGINIFFTIEIPIIKNGISAIDISRARVNAKKSAYDYYEIVKSVEKEVVNVWNKVLTMSAVIKASQEAEKSAVLAFEGIKKESSLNLKGITEFLNTEYSLLKARSNLVEAKINYIINVYNLLFMINSIKF